MAGFLYYVPGPAGHDLVEQFGLADRLAGARVFSRSCLRGPDGNAGTVVCDAAALPTDGDGGYYPDRQTWRQMPGEPACRQVGIWNDHRPAPADLIRPRPVPGSMLRSDAGDDWMVPRVLIWPQPGESAQPAITLDRRMDLDHSGRWVPVGVCESHRRMLEIVGRWLGTILEGRADVDEQEMFSNAVELLAVNYRIGAPEAAMLGLITEASAAEIIRLALDLQFAVETASKKNESVTYSGSSTMPGVTD